MPGSGFHGSAAGRPPPLAPTRSSLPPRLVAVAGIGLLAFAVLASAGRVWLWLAPYNLDGLASEAGLWLLAAPLGWAAAAALRRLFRRTGGGAWPWRAGAIGALYLIAAATRLGWDPEDGVGFGRHAYATFSSPGCEFAARFPAPPRHGRFVARGTPLEGRYATLGDVATVTGFRADCLVLTDAARAAGVSPETLASAGLRRSIEEDRLRDATEGATSVRGLRVLTLEGRLGGSILPDRDDGKPRTTLVAARAYVGVRSVLTLSIYQPEGETPSPDARRFLESGRPRPAARP